MHAMIWGSLVRIGGLAFGIGLGHGHRVRLLFLALVAACLGTAAYEVIGALLDPLALTSDPISKTWTTRLLRGCSSRPPSAGALLSPCPTRHRGGIVEPEAGAGARPGASDEVTSVPADHATTSLTTLPWTSVRRKSRPA